MPVNLWGSILKRPLLSVLVSMLVGTASAASVPVINATAPQHRGIYLAQTADAPAPPADPGTQQPQMPPAEPQPPANPEGQNPPPPPPTQPGDVTAPNPPQGGSDGSQPPPPPPSGDQDQNQNRQPQTPSGGDGRQYAPGTEGGNSGSGGAPGKQGGGNQMGPNGGGMSDEQRQAQDEKQQAQQEKMDKQNLARMKTGMKQAQTQVTQMKKFFTKQAAKGIATPAECTQALTDVQAIIDTVKNATTMDEANEVDTQDMGDGFSTLNECRQTIETLSRIPAMFKQVDKQIKTMESQWNRTKKGAPDEASGAIADGDGVLKAIKEARVKATDLFKQGNAEDVEATIQDEVFGRFEDLGSAMQRVDAVKNSKRFFADYLRRTKDAEKTIAKLKKKGEDVSAAQTILADMKRRYELIKGMDVGSDEFMDAVEELMQRQQDLTDEIGGTTPQVDQYMSSGTVNGPNLQMPKF